MSLKYSSFAIELAVCSPFHSAPKSPCLVFFFRFFLCFFSLFFPFPFLPPRTELLGEEESLIPIEC